MSKEVLISHIEKAKCSMLSTMPLDTMTKADILIHLSHSKCPELKKMMDST